jgi:nucleoid DNA-binding protein
MAAYSPAFLKAAKEKGASMKLKELNEAIASACNVRAQVVTAIQAETFKQLSAALDKGERVTIPDFGIFAVKDIAGGEGQPAKKVVRFKQKTGEVKKREGGQGREGRGEARRQKRAEAKAAKAHKSDEAGDEE